MGSDHAFDVAVVRNSVNVVRRRQIIERTALHMHRFGRSLIPQLKGLGLLYRLVASSFRQLNAERVTENARQRRGVDVLVVLKIGNGHLDGWIAASASSARFFSGSHNSRRERRPRAYPCSDRGQSG